MKPRLLCIPHNHKNPKKKIIYVHFSVYKETNIQGWADNLPVIDSIRTRHCDNAKKLWASLNHTVTCGLVTDPKRPKDNKSPDLPWTYYVAQAALKFRILLHQPPECWDYRHTLPYLVLKLSSPRKVFLISSVFYILESATARFWPVP